MLRRSLYSVTLVAFFTCMGALSTTGSAKSEEKDKILEQGADVYMQSRCFVCHGQFGSGTLGPKFSGNLDLKEKTYVATQILVGRGEMPAYAHRLSNDEIADVATYVRNSWGNAFGSLTPQDVAKARDLRKQAAQQTAAPTKPQQ
jgi:mono/diheme cytochrome c family protein